MEHTATAEERAIFKAGSKWPRFVCVEDTVGNHEFDPTSSLADVLVKKHADLEKVIMALELRKGTKVVMQMGLMDGYLKTGKVGDTRMAGLGPGQFMIFGDVEQALLAGLRILAHFGPTNVDGRDEGSVLYYDRGGVVNVKVHFTFDSHPIFLSLIEQAGQSQIVIYARD